MGKRRLTSGEIKLAKSVFSTSVDYDKVHVHDEAFIPGHPKGVGMAPNGNIYFNGCCEDDFSKLDIAGQAFFIHEMTHVWQYQNKVLNPIKAFGQELVKHKFNYQASYPYKIEKKKELTQYGMEQQACIVQDYFLLKNGYMPLRETSELKDPAQLKESFESVLKEFLNDPAYPRARKKTRVNRRRPPKGPGR